MDLKTNKNENFSLFPVHLIFFPYDIIAKICNYKVFFLFSDETIKIVIPYHCQKEGNTADRPDVVHRCLCEDKFLWFLLRYAQGFPARPSDF
jgi:hypothetical protein